MGKSPLSIVIITVTGKVQKEIIWDLVEWTSATLKNLIIIIAALLLILMLKKKPEVFFHHQSKLEHGFIKNQCTMDPDHVLNQTLLMNIGKRTNKYKASGYG